MERTIFDAEHRAYRDSVRAFIAMEVLPYYDAWDRAGIAPRELFARAGELGAFAAVPEDRRSRGRGLPVQRRPPRGGGPRRGRPRPPRPEHAGGRLPALPARADHRGAAGAVAAGHLLGRADHRHRHDRAHHRLGPGRHAHHGGAQTATATWSTASKTFITNGINADLVITAVRTDPTQRHKGMSLVVPSGAWTASSAGRNLDKVGLHAQDTAELFFTDVAVPVGEPARRRGAGLRAPGRQPSPGAAVDRHGRRGRRPGPP